MKFKKYLATLSEVIDHSFQMAFAVMQSTLYSRFECDWTRKVSLTSCAATQLFLNAAIVRKSSVRIILMHGLLRFVELIFV